MSGNETHPDVLVLDISMPDLDGIAVVKKIKPRYPDLRILILTVHEDEALLREAIRAALRATFSSGPRRPSWSRPSGSSCGATYTWTRQCCGPCSWKRKASGLSSSPLNP